MAKRPTSSAPPEAQADTPVAADTGSGAAAADVPAADATLAVDTQGNGDEDASSSAPDTAAPSDDVSTEGAGEKPTEVPQPEGEQVKAGEPEASQAEAPAEVVQPAEAEASAEGTASADQEDEIGDLGGRVILVRSVSNAGRRRAGIAFGPVPVPVRVDDLSEDELGSLLADPQLIISLDD